MYSILKFFSGQVVVLANWSKIQKGHFQTASQQGMRGKGFPLLLMQSYIRLMEKIKQLFFRFFWKFWFFGSLQNSIRTSFSIIPSNSPWNFGPWGFNDFDFRPVGGHFATHLIFITFSNQFCLAQMHIWQTQTWYTIQKYDPYMDLLYIHVQYL